MREYFLYFDESGNLGVKDRYFVIACILTENPKELENIMKKTLLHIKKTYNNTKWNGHELKANSCKPWVKEIIYKAIGSKNVEIAYIVGDKFWIEERLKNNNNLLYNFMLKILLDNFKNIFRNNKVNLILDNKTIKVKSFNSFRDYIDIHINYELKLNSEITVEYRESNAKNAYNIQAVDYVANAIFAKYEYGYNTYYDMISEKIKKIELYPYRKFGKDKLKIREIAVTKEVDKV